MTKLQEAIIFESYKLTLKNLNGGRITRKEAIKELQELREQL